MKLFSSYIRNLVFIQLLFMGTPAQSQELYFDLRNNTGAADFLFGSRLVENASYTSSSLAVSSVLSDISRAYLEFSHSHIYPFEKYSYSQGELGLQLRYLKIRDNQFFAGLFVLVNDYEDEYSYYKNSGLGLYGKWKHYFKASQLVTIGYDLNLKKYAEVTEASNTEHEIFISYNQSFRTKTSLNLESAIALQNFWPQTSEDSWGGSLSGDELNNIPSKTLVTNKLRVSQSLGNKIGLTLWLSAQVLLNDKTDTSSLQDGLENPFTDRFRWEGPSSALRLIYRLNPDNRFQLSHAYASKSFVDVPVYRFDFETMEYELNAGTLVNLGHDREYVRNKIGFQWTKNWTLTRYDWVSGFELILGTGWTQNSSNDPLYDYTSRNYSLSLNFNS